MTLAKLIRWAGLVGVAAAVLIVVSQLLGLYAIDPNDVIGPVNSVPATVFNMLKLLSSVLLLVGFVGLYARQSVEAGLLGLIAFLGTTLVTGDWWYEGFAVPWLAEAAPRVLEGAATGRVDAFGSVQAGSFTSLVLLAVGWVLFGVATFRGSRSFHAGPPCGDCRRGDRVPGRIPPYQILLALGVGCMGAWLFTRGGVQQQAVPKIAGYPH